MEFLFSDMFINDICTSFLL